LLPLRLYSLFPYTTLFRSAEIEVLRLKGSGNRDRHSGIRTGSGHGTDPNRVQVEVLLVRNDLQDMLAGGERHACLADPLEGAPTSEDHTYELESRSDVVGR